MSRAEYWGARRRYRTLLEAAADLVTLGYTEQAAALTAEAKQLGATDIHVEVSCLVCGKDAGITCRPDENFASVSRNGLCGACNEATTNAAEAAMKDRQ